MVRKVGAQMTQATIPSRLIFLAFGESPDGGEQSWTYTVRSDVRDWIVEHGGRIHIDVKRDCPGASAFFPTEADVVMFALRWSDE